ASRRGRAPRLRNRFRREPDAHPRLGGAPRARADGQRGAVADGCAGRRDARERQHARRFRSGDAAERQARRFHRAAGESARGHPQYAEARFRLARRPGDPRARRGRRGPLSARDCDVEVRKCSLRRSSSAATSVIGHSIEGNNMNPRRTTIQVASILLLSAGLAAAQSQETPPPTEPAPSAQAPATPDQQPAVEPSAPTSAPPPADRRGVTEELIVTGSRIRRKDLATPDLNTIPTEAVDRVEVLKDGASAVYGSDAIAGVVNVITRKNYTGTDLGAQYGVSGKGDANTFDAHVTTGTSGDAAGAMFSARYFNQKDSWLRDRSWAQQALDFDYTGGGVAESGSSRTP